MTDADKRLCREMFDVVAPAGAADFRTRALAELREFARSEQSCGNLAREAAVRVAIKLVERLPLTKST